MLSAELKNPAEGRKVGGIQPKEVRKLALRGLFCITVRIRVVWSAV